MITDQKTESNGLTDLVQRLRGEHGTDPWQINPAAKIAADAIEHLMLEIDVLDYAWKTKNERIAELEAALKPFAEIEPYICSYEERPIYAFT